MLFGTQLKFFTSGLLFSGGVFIFVIFLYSLRECFYSQASGVSSFCLGIILSEFLLFVSYFWGAFSFSFSCSLDGFPSPSTRSLVLIITFLLASLSVLSGYMYCTRDKGLVFLGSSVFWLGFTTAIIFTWLQASEFVLLGLYINNSVAGSLFFCLTGLHFMHVVAGLAIFCVYFWCGPTMFIISNHNQSVPHGYHTHALAQPEGFVLLYWHFVEFLWLCIQFVIYSE